MSKTPPSQLAYDVMGVGLYGQSCAQQNLTNHHAVQDKILEAVETMPMRGANHVFTIGDYGCATVPAPSLCWVISSAFDQAVDERFLMWAGHVRKRAQQPVPVLVIYEDQPTNDFNSLFKRVHGLIPEPRTYLEEFSDVYVMASATSFFRPVMPPDTFDVIFSLGSAHFLSDPGPSYQDSFHRFPNATAEESAAVEALAARDWDTFLLQRARELQSGGILFVSMPAYDPKGTVNGVQHCSQGTEEVLLKAWRDMRDEGHITQEEFVNTNTHRCPRNVEECTRPFLVQDSAVRRQGLELISADLRLVPCAAKAKWKTRLEKEGVDTRDDWVHAIMLHHQIWSRYVFFQALSDVRPTADKEALVNEVFARVQSEIERQGPDEFLNDYLMVYVLARKR